MSKTNQIVNTIDMEGPVAEVFWAKFDYGVEQFDLIKKQNENLLKHINILEQKIDDLRKPRNYTIEEMCEILRVCDNKLREYRKKGLMDNCSDGKKIWFTQEHLDEFYRRTDSRNKGKLQKVG